MSRFMPDASVIICAHNPHRDYIERTLEALRVQTLPKDRWELIIVDNASSSPVADMCDLSWQPHGRHVREPELGLASARHRGIRESSGKLLIFVDDDNVLAPDYLSRALIIENDFAFLGAWGSGCIELEFEVAPPRHLQGMLPWLGLRQTERPIWSNAISCSEATPIGAGLCIRRSIGESYVEFCRGSTIQISGRKGASLGGHEDFEMCYLSCKAGRGMGLFPELRLLHLIKGSRVTDAHFLRLIENQTLSKLTLAYKWQGILPRSPFSLHGAASMALNLLKRRGFERRVYFAELRSVIAARRLDIESASVGAQARTPADETVASRRCTQR
jgi:glycosyltransferase involved in cell wall biosynthesis